jgi:hypothetical protein
MATAPTITNELVDLVETMRQAQKHYDELINDREGRATQHQVRRAEQAKRDAETRVDAFLISYHLEMKKYLAHFDGVRTDEMPGFYDATKKT